MLTVKARLQQLSNEVAALIRHDFSKNEEVMMMRKWLLVVRVFSRAVMLYAQLLKLSAQNTTTETN